MPSLRTPPQLLRACPELGSVAQACLGVVAVTAVAVVTDAASRRLGCRRRHRQLQHRGLVALQAAPEDGAACVGFGYTSEAIADVAASDLWAAMLEKTGEGIVDFLPVSDVQVEHRNGFIWRSMRFLGAGPLQGKTMLQHIYADADAGEIRFVSLNDDGEESDEEVVNALLHGPLRIQYCKRHTRTKAPIDWAAPLARTEAAIRRTIEVARAG